MVRKQAVRKNSFRRDTRFIRERWHARVAVLVRLLVWGGILAGTSLMLIFGYDFFTQWDYFQARQVIIQGNVRTTRPEIMNQAGVAPGVNILGLNLAAVRKRLTAHPWIADAEVRRRLPDRIEIGVTEHEAACVLELGGRYLMNRRGEVFKAHDPSDPDGLPVVIGLSAADVHPGVAGPGRPLAALLEVFRLAEKPGGRLPLGRIREIHVDPELGVTLQAFDHQVRLTLGYEDYDAKYHCLERILTYIEKRGQSFADIEAVNLTNTDRIVLRSATIDLHGNNQEKEV